VAIESPAHAAFGPCYNRGGYSFEDGTDAIDIYSGAGCGTYMGFILATHSSIGSPKSMYSVNSNAVNLPAA
jgi:hypothetical protein